MKVIALKPCFVAGVYYRVGDTFDVNPADFKQDKDGKPVFSRSSTPSFKVVEDLQSAKAEAAKIKRAAEDKQKEGALAASGGNAAKRKADELRDLVG